MRRALSCLLALGGCSVLNGAFEGEGAEGNASAGGTGPDGGATGSGMTGVDPASNSTSEDPPDDESSTGDPPTGPPPFCPSVVWGADGTASLLAMHTTTWENLAVRALPLAGISAIATTPVTGHVWAFPTSAEPTVVEYDPAAQESIEHPFDPPLNKAVVVRAGAAPGGGDVFFMYHYEPVVYRLVDGAEAYVAEEVITLQMADPLDGDFAAGPRDNSLLAWGNPFTAHHFNPWLGEIAGASSVTGLEAGVAITGLAHKDGSRYWATASNQVVELQYEPGGDSVAMYIMTPAQVALPAFTDLAETYLPRVLCDQLTAAIQG